MTIADPSPTSPKQQAAKALVSSPSRGKEGAGRQAIRGSSKTTLGRAKKLRRDMTPQEKLLWRYLRDRRLGGFKFRDQQPLGLYVGDFVCQEQKLIVEADGSQHAESAHDARRDEFLKSKGYRTLRFWNNEINNQLPEVLETILATLTSSPPEGEETQALAACCLGDVGEGSATSADNPRGALNA